MLTSSRQVTFRTRGLTKVYGTGDVAVHALRGIDLELYKGELVVLLGPSGSGKSTFLNILGGLDAPTAGQAFFKDQELHNGLSEGEHVIVYPNDRIAEGVRIAPRG